MKKIYMLFFSILLTSFGFLLSAELSSEDDLSEMSSSLQELTLDLKKKEVKSPELAELNKELAKAIKSGNVKEIKKLLKKGAKIDEVESPRSGYSALHMAVLAEKNVFETIETVLKSGAETAAKGKDGRTFLYTFIAQYTGEAFDNFAACAWLYKIDLNVVDKYKNTLFHAAAEAGRLDWIVYLLGLFECRFKAKKHLLDFILLLKAENDDGETAYNVAKRKELFSQKTQHNFCQSAVYAKIAEKIQERIDKLDKKWASEKSSDLNASDSSLDSKEKDKIKRRMRCNSVGVGYNKRQ